MRTINPPSWLTSDITYVIWESDTRRYGMRIGPNLWGDLEIRKEWGSRFNRRGQSRAFPVLSADDAISLIAKEDQRRTRRGYKWVKTG